MTKTNDRPTTLELVLEGERGGEERFEFTLEMCDSPVCPCREVTLVQRVRRRGNGGERAPARRVLIVDPFSQGLAERDARSAADPHARELVAAIEDEQWARLRRMFLAAKERAIAAMDPDVQQASFDFEEIERRNRMPAYREIVPFAEPITVTRGKERFLIEPHHCIRPGCVCHLATLTVLELESAGHGVVLADATVAELDVDHASGEWSDRATGGPVRGVAREMVDLLLAHHAGILDVLRQQQDVLRRLYRASRGARSGKREGEAGVAAPAARVAAASPKVSRNAPCPCGSGKKYKRCCAAG